MSTLFSLFDACQMDVMPSPAVRCDYGFNNMCDYHSNVPSAETTLLRVYQMIVRDILHLEQGGSKDVTLSSIGVSREMFLEAYENNALDDFVQKFIRSIIKRGKRSPRCCMEWLQHKLIIGPTRVVSEEVALTGHQIANMRYEVYRRYYE